ncbi:MAG: hypothetical protein ACRERC_23905 [Candidatus Binatia bacterium]
MGIDPMLISGAAANGMIEFGGAAVVWWVLMGLLTASAGAIWLSVAPRPPASIAERLRLGHTQLAAVGLSRGR